MSTPRRLTRSSVLGKRSAHAAADDDADVLAAPGAPDVCAADALPTPDQTPRAKRPKTTNVVEDGLGNKENIPPFVALFVSPSPRRALRRSATESSTASSSRSSLRRSVSVLSLPPSTPATALSTLSIATPPDSPPSVLIPLHARARGLLRATCNGDTAIAGRASERAAIADFLTSFVASECGPATLYISGLPGTGKTALVNDVIRNMELDEAVVVSLNCMALNDFAALWDRFQEELGAVAKPRGRGRPKKLSGKDAVEKMIKDSTKKCIVVLDELDHITKTSASLDDLFTLASEHADTLRIIGIANTHTLTASTSKSKLEGAAGVQTLHFSAYTGEQLVAIVKSRLAPLSDDVDHTEALKKLLPTPALMLLAKKVAAMTGDVRAVFEVLRGAIDLAVVQSGVIDAPIVTPTRVLAALKLYAPTQATTSAAAPAATTPVAAGAHSELAMQVRQLGLHSRLVLLALVLATRRAQAGLPLSGSGSGTTPPAPSSPTKSPTKRSTSASAIASAGASGVEGGALHAFYAALLARADSGTFAPVSRSEFADLLGMLETVGLAALSTAGGGVPGSPSKTGRRALGRSASFAAGRAAGATQDVTLAAGVRLDEILRGLGCAGAQAPPGVDADPREEELRAIWEREQARIVRESKARKPSGAPVDTFADASED